MYKSLRINRNLYYGDKFNEYGIRVFGNFQSFLEMNFCPWCGECLPTSKREEWFATLENMGFDDPMFQSIPAAFNTAEWWKQEIKQHSYEDDILSPDCKKKDKTSEIIIHQSLRKNPALTKKIHCCEALAIYLEENSNLYYNDEHNEYGIRLFGKFYSYIVLRFCPCCGKELGTNQGRTNQGTVL